MRSNDIERDDRIVKPGLLAGLSLLALLGAAGAARAADVEPRLTFEPDPAQPSVALTFDACSGAVDHRILDALIEAKAKATIFVTERWLKKNEAALATLKAHPELFEIENHGAHHVPAITDRPTVYGLKTAGSIEAVRAEVKGGSAAVVKAMGGKPAWFRGASARYSLDAVAEIEAEGLRIAGYSVNADQGASLPAKSVAKRIAAAKSGDVVIAHINQPTHASGEGVVEGLRSLKAAGFQFVRLDEVKTRSDDRPELRISRKEPARGMPKSEMRPEATPASCAECGAKDLAPSSGQERGSLPDLPPAVSVGDGKIGGGGDPARR